MEYIEQSKICCFFGHRKIKESEELKNNVCSIIEKLIINEKVETFLFGSKSEFDRLCLEAVTDLKGKYPHITRVYVRASYQYIDDSYKKYLLESYDLTYYPEKIENSGKASYIKRNQEMIDCSKFCVVYYDEKYLPPKRKKGKRDLFDYQPKSGTQIAFKYAVTRNKEIYNMYVNL